MIKFDKIKIHTKAEYISNFNFDVVEVRTNKNSVSYICNQKQPFNLYIQCKQATNEAVIEFSSKILADDYPMLISRDTIHKCFENIASLGWCQLKIDDILNDSIILSCDVTIDIDGINLPEDFKTLLISNLKDISKFNVQKYGTSGYTITKLLKTKCRQLRLSIYDKYKELNMAANNNFLKMLANEDVLMNYFKDKYRIESNLKTHKQIRDVCQTEDTHLLNVLDSNCNPLLKIFDTIFICGTIECDIDLKDRRTIFDYDSLNQLRDALILKACKYNLQLVKTVFDKYLSPKTNKRKYYHNVKKLQNSSSDQNQNSGIIGQIRDKLIA